MKYRSVVVTRRGGPQAFQVIENDLRLPAAVSAIHQVTPFLTVLSTAGTLYLLSNRG